MADAAPTTGVAKPMPTFFATTNQCASAILRRSGLGRPLASQLGRK